MDMVEFVGHQNAYVVADNKVNKLEQMENAFRLFDLFKEKINSLNEQVKQDGVVANFDNRIRAIIDIVDCDTKMVSGSVTLPHNIYTIENISTHFGIQCAWKEDHTRHQQFERSVYEKYPLIRVIEQCNVSYNKDAMREYVMAINLLHANKVVDNT